MDLQTLEKAARIIFTMCEQHPELCPHDWQWIWTSAPDENGKRVAHYKCSLCGSEYEQIKD